MRRGRSSFTQCSSGAPRSSCRCGATEMKRQNLDVAGTSHDPERPVAKESERDSAPAPYLSVVCPFPAQPDRQQQHRGRYRPHGSKYISIPQATNIIEAVNFAKSIGLPLVAHLTIHWSGTIAFDDPDCTRFAKVRKGLNKILFRRGIPGAWVVQSSHRHRALPSTFSTPATVPFECKARSDQGCTGSLSWSPR